MTEDITTTDDPEMEYGTCSPAAAEAGVSVATLKRYARIGLVKALRTTTGVHVFELNECRRLRAARERARETR